MPSESGAATTSEDVRREQRQDRPPVQEEPIADVSTEQPVAEAPQEEPAAGEAPVVQLPEIPQEEPIADGGTEKGTPEATQAGAGASS